MTNLIFKPCFIIPNYNHGDTLSAVLTGLASFGLKVFVVDDGSDFANQELIVKSCSNFANAELFRHAQNQGKGAAVMSGLKLAFSQGYTHAIQVDGDGQHDLTKVQKLLELSEKNQNAIVCGQPVYDESVPKARLWGRYLTHVWVWIETLSFDIRDSMCGFRSYPLLETVSVLENKSIGRRMSFDTEILVRLYWKGVPILFMPVSVIYPVGGKSQFRMVLDNVLISWMHTRLVFGMLLRLPILLSRKFSSRSENNWARIQEVGTVSGMKLLLALYSLLGRSFLAAVLYPVAFYYYLTNSKVRSASNDYILSLKKFSKSNGLPEPQLTVFQHIYQFSLMMLDKFAAWRGDISLEDLQFPDQRDLHDYAKTGRGLVVLTSHFGNPDVLRALVRNFPTLKVNVVVYFKNSQKFTSVLKALSQESHLNIIPVESFGVETAIRLQQMVDQGEWVFITGDRIPYTGNDKVSKANFLGREANFPVGPFILGQVLGAPIFAMHCYRQGEKFVVRTKALDIPNAENKTNRKDRIQNITNAYVSELEANVLSAPGQWFNFYNFWQTQ